MISGSISASNASNTSNKKWPICIFRPKKFPPKISWRRRMASEMSKWQKMSNKKPRRSSRWQKLLRSLKTSNFRTKSQTHKKRLRKLRKWKRKAPARRNRKNNWIRRLRKKNEITWIWTSSIRRISSSQTKRQKI